MRVPIPQLADVGVVKDVPDYLLPPNALTDVRNIRIRNGMLERMAGHAAILDPPSIAPYWLLPVISPTKEAGIVYAGLNKVYAFLSATHSNITRQTASVDVDYSATADGLWNGGILAGIPVLNNGVDVPQYWANISGGQRLANLTNWPSGWRARIVRPYRNFLVAMDVTESGTRYINRYRTSHPAQPGGIPSSWDDTDPTKDATINDLTDVTAGGIVDGVVLRDTFIIYKERSTWGMQFVGGEFKMRTYQIFDTMGAMGTHCATAFGDGSKHFVFTGEDLIVHDGQQFQSVVDEKMRKWILDNISSTTYNRSFVIANNDHKECWLCIPLEGASWPNLAIVWSQKDNTISLREITDASFMAQSIIPDATSDPWDSDMGTWDTDLSTWGEAAGSSFKREVVQANPVGTKLYQMDSGTDFAGVAYSSYIEKTGISIYGTSNDGTILGDIEMNKLVRSIYPRATGGTLQIQVGRQQQIEGPITWGPVHEFVPGVDQKVDVLDDIGGSCKLYGLRFTWPSGSAASLRTFDIDVEPLGLY